MLSLLKGREYYVVYKNSLGIPDGEVEDLGAGYLFMDSIMPKPRA